MEELGLDDREIAWRKAFLEFGEEDAQRLASAHEVARAYAQPVIDDFYRHLLSFEESRSFFADPRVLAYVKRRQVEYFQQLTGGAYGDDYIEERLHIGAVHERVGVESKTYLGMYAYYLRLVLSHLRVAWPDDPERVFSTFASVIKLVFLDINLALDTYFFRRERTIRLQQEAIREISTPVLPMRPGLLILPVIGALDTLRAQQLTEQLLLAIRNHRAKVVVIDITGVPVMDTKVANHLVQTIEAARLLGARSLLTGLSPEIAETIVRLGVDLSSIETMADLQGGMEAAERFLGYRLVRDREG
jgi:rsbT co-antagonist protein RsbR